MGKKHERGARKKVVKSVIYLKEDGLLPRSYSIPLLPLLLTSSYCQVVPRFLRSELNWQVNGLP